MGEGSLSVEFLREPLAYPSTPGEGEGGISEEVEGVTLGKAHFLY